MAQSNGFIKVSILPSGFLTLPEHCFCASQEDESIRTTVPSMSFLLQHPTTGHNLVFDLGMRRDLSVYPASIQPHLRKRQPIITIPDASDSLRLGGMQPSSIDAVILSHVHYDHVGTPSDFTRAKFIVGYGTRHLLKHGMQYHSAAKFEPDLLRDYRVIELPLQSKVPKYKRPVENEFAPTLLGLGDFVPGGVDHEWQEVGPFDNAIDLYGDGLAFIIDSPGHIPGYLNVLTKIGHSKWVYLAGDACHHVDILDGKTGMALWMEDEKEVCIHVDKELAEDTVSRIRQLKEGGFSDGEEVQVVLAHDPMFFREHQDAVWPGSLS